MLTNCNALAPILFDNDGVLLDSESAFFSLTRSVFASHGLELSSALWARHFLGEGLHTWLIAGLLGMNETNARSLARERDALWRERLRMPVEQTPGISTLLTELHERGHRMAVVTGAPRNHFEGLHNHTNLLRNFEFCITYDECQQVKPSPDAYLLAAQRMGVDPASCIAVEDSPRGLRAALSAGMRCALLVTSLTDLEMCVGATWTVYNVESLRQVLLANT